MLDGCSGQILLEYVDLTYLINSFKDRYSCGKWLQVFAIWRFVNMSRLHLRGMSTGYAASQWWHPDCSQQAIQSLQEFQSFFLFEVQHAVEMGKSKKKKWADKKARTRSLFKVFFISSLGWSCHEPLPLSAKPFFSSSQKSALLFLGPGFDFFTVHGLFSAFLMRFMILTWQVTHEKQCARGQNKITCKQNMLMKNT